MLLTLAMSGKCFCCGLPSFGMIEDRLVCHLCLVTFCKPKTYESESCSLCEGRLQGEESKEHTCSCGYIGSTQPCCPQCQYSNNEGYASGFLPGDSAAWICTKCGLEDIMTSFCPQCAPDIPEDFQPVELRKYGKSPRAEPNLQQILEEDMEIPYDASGEVQASDLWRCSCGYEYNLASLCERCGLEPTSAPSPPQISPPIPIWICQECAYGNPNNPECMQCGCPKAANSPPCSICGALNLMSSQYCRRCNSLRIQSSPPAPTCPACSAPLTGPDEKCSACSSPAETAIPPKGKSGGLKAKLKQLRDRFFYS